MEDKGLFPPKTRLYVGRRDCTHLAQAMAKQVGTVRHILLSDAVPIHAALSFQAEWPLLSRPFDVEGVTVGWGKVIRKRITASGPLGASDVDRIARLLDGRLPQA